MRNLGRQLLMGALLFVGSCQNQASDKEVLNNTGATVPPTTTANPEPAQEEVEIIDASALAVTGITVANMTVSNRSVESLSFEADGRSEYVDYLICPMKVTGKTCTENLIGTPSCGLGGDCVPAIATTNRVTLPVLYEGQITIKVRACVNVKNAKDKNVTCGPFTEHPYNSQRFNARLASLNSTATRLKTELGVLNIKYKDVLQKYVDDAAACDNLAADVRELMDRKSQLIKTYIRAPTAWFQKAGEDLADTILGNGATGIVLGAVDDFTDTISKAGSNLCDRIGDASDDKVCEFLKIPGALAGQFIKGLSPISSFGTMENALFNVYYGTFMGKGERLTPRGCFAEKNMQLSVEQITQAMSTKLTLLKELATEIMAAGG